MPVNFGPERWQKIRENYRKWWAGELGRPLIQIQLWGADPGRPKPDSPLLEQDNCNDFSISPEAIIDRWDYELSCHHFLGDAFPFMPLHAFGPGVIAAFLGARLEVRQGQVWFFPPDECELGQLHFEHDDGNQWLERIRAICKAASEYWQGNVLVAAPDLGGPLDLLATFRPGEKLLFDLCDYPDLVKQRTRELQDLWWKYFGEINDALLPANPGYSAWASIYSSDPYYMLQCDFAYMISPKMFDEFVRPDLEASCRKLANPFYHLDGPGQLPHLDLLLQIEGLKGVQWVSGAGRKPEHEWPDVYRRIRGAGKLTQLYGDAAALDKLVSDLGSAEGILLIYNGRITEDEAMRFLDRYGALD